ncbi:IclR family transcriptional regulator [Devosia naphthalenivorans]|uniref:IclR family transcriptional regulator n=1 Tax=Devosia naphthalenivorans TaxID=2082392 RepID=UPI0013B05CB6|nr:IclR family transcriptional regulator [Devosia naphthalenivorans]
MPTSKTENVKAASEARYKAPALTKGLLILETLAEYPAGLSLTEIAKRLQMTVNEIFRMVITLQEQKYISLGEDEKFRLTLKLFEIAHRQEPVHSIVTVALPHMQQLANKTLQSCHLAVYYDGRSMIVAQVDSPERWTFSVKVGAIVDLLQTSSGNVMLAFSSDLRRTQMLEEHRSLPTSRPIDETELNLRLAEVRSQGGWSAKSQQTVGVTNIARPIFAQDNSVAGVLIVPFLDRVSPEDQPSLDEVKTQLALIAKDISRLLGFSGPRTGG